MKIIRTFDDLTTTYDEFQVGDYITLPKNKLGNGVFNCLQIVDKQHFWFKVEYIMNRGGKDFFDRNIIYDLNGITSAEPSVIEEYELKKYMAKYNL